MDADLKCKGFDKYSDEILDVVDDGCAVGCRVDKYGCFVGDTKVKTTQGLRDIDHLHSGDKIIAYDKINNQSTEKLIQGIKKYLVNSLIAIILTIGDTLYASENHPIYTEQGIVMADQLSQGSILKSNDGKIIQIANIISKDTLVDVYDIDIEGEYGYYVGDQSILVAKGDLCSELNARPNLTTALDALPSGKKGELMKDLGSITDPSHRQALMDVLNSKQKGIEAWSRIRLAICNTTNGGFTEFAIDPNSVEKVINMIEPTSNFRVAMGANWEQELSDIIHANKDLRCPTCSTGLNNIPPMDKMLENVEHISQFSSKPGYNSVLTALKSSPENRDGINHMIVYLKANSAEFANISEFEFRYADDILNRADVLVGNIKYEFKSWTPGVPYPWNAFFAGNGTSYTQFIRYLQNSASLDELKYIFNGAKADVTDVKTAFKDLFSGLKKDEIFETIWGNQSLREDLFPTSNYPPNLPESELKTLIESDFETMISDTQSIIFNFIKT